MQNFYGTQCSYDVSPYSYSPIGTLAAMEDNMGCNLSYPEVYYKVQPFVMSVCDQMESCGRMMLSQEMFDQISDDIYTNVCMMYPDLAEYANSYDMKSSVETAQRNREFFPNDGDDRDRGFFPNNRFRRRGLFPDFVDLLLLIELFRR